MPTRRANKLAHSILVILLVPSFLFAQVPPEAEETLDALQDTPGLSISTAGPCCDPPSIWDFLGYHDVEEHIHGTLQTIAELPLFAGLLGTINTGLQMMGLAPSAAGESGLPGDEAAGGLGAPGAGGPPEGAEGPAADIAAKIEADKQAAEVKIQTLEYLGQQDCNLYPEIVPAILAELDDPNEPVRYAALVALQRQCRELRCSTLTATRLRYELHGRDMIPLIRQCASCACQEQVIKRLSDLLLDKTVLGYPKENSPRVRSLAAALIERCLQQHPPDADAPDEVQPDPPPTPIPDPTPDSSSATSQPGFPRAPLLRGGFSQSGNWFRGFLGLGRADRDDRTIYRGQEPGVVFDWSQITPADRAEPGWDVVAGHATDEAPDESSGAQWRAIESAPHTSDVEVFEEMATTSVPDDEKPLSETRDDLEELHASIARSEQTIRESFAGRDDQFREQYRTATTALFEARLALALSGDSDQLANLVQDNSALWEHAPHTFAAVTSLNALTRYYQTVLQRPGPDRVESLQRYARCLSFQVAELEVLPVDAPPALFATARDLLELNLVSEAATCLYQITEHCAESPVYSESVTLLAEVERTLRAGVPDPEASIAPPHPDPEVDQRSADRLYAAVASAEEMVRASYGDRDGSDNGRFVSAMATLCEARMQLALLGDSEQFAMLNHTAAALCEKSPNTPSAIIAVDAITRYYEKFAAENSPQRQNALPQYAKCLRYQIANFVPTPEGAPQKLFAVAQALARDGMHAEATSCLNQILVSCPDSPVAPQATRLRAGIESASQRVVPTSAQAPNPAQTIDGNTAEQLDRAHAPPAEPAPPAPTERSATAGTLESAPPSPESPTSPVEFPEEAENSDVDSPAPAELELSAGMTDSAPAAPTDDTTPTVAPVDSDRAKPERMSQSSTVSVGDDLDVVVPLQDDSNPQTDFQHGGARWQAMIADAESEIEATFADRDGSARDRYESSVEALCEARFQLALLGDEEQFHRLYQTTSALCKRLPNSVSAAIAVDALSRFYEWHSAEDSPQRPSALPEYARCLRYQIAVFDPMPADAPAKLLRTAEALLADGMPADAILSLRRILQSCPNDPVATDAALLLAEVDALTAADVAETELTEVVNLEEASIQEVEWELAPPAPLPPRTPSQETLATAANESAPVSPSETEQQPTADHDVLQALAESVSGTVDTEYLLPPLSADLLQVEVIAIADAGAATELTEEADLEEVQWEPAPPTPLPPRAPSEESLATAAIESAPAAPAETEQPPTTDHVVSQALAESISGTVDTGYLLPPLSVDLLQAEVVGAGAVWEPARDPSVAPQAESTTELATSAASAESAPAAPSVDSAAPGVEATVVVDESAPGSPEESATTVGANATGIREVVELATTPLRTTRPATVAPTAPEETRREITPQNDTEQLHAALADAELEIRTTFADRAGASRNRYEQATAALCEARLQLALDGDSEQFTHLYQDAETLCAQAPDSRAAAVAMNALARFYAAHVDETTPEGQGYLRKHAGCLRYQVANLQAFSEETPQELYNAAIMLRRAGLNSDAIACLRVLATQSAAPLLSGGAAALLAEWESPAVPPDATVPEAPAEQHPVIVQVVNSVESPSEAVPHVPENEVAVDPPEEEAGPVELVIRQRPRPDGSPETPGTAAENSDDEVSLTQSTTGETGDVARLDEGIVPVSLEVPDAQADDVALDDSAVIDLETFLAAGLPAVDVSQIDVAVSEFQLVQNPPLVPPAAGYESEPVQFEILTPGEVVIEPIEDPFLPSEMEKNLHARALDALQANQFAYGHLQEEDNVVERYNNSVGVDALPYSLFHIYAAIPNNLFRLRLHSVWGYDRPDRSEYFWNRIAGAGPLSPETGLDYQQIYVYQETKAGDFASAFTEYPIWVLDPDVNSNTAGIGDIVVGAKAVLIQDDDWTLSTINRAYTPVGTTRRGLGRRHLSLESGVALQWRIGRQTMLHSDLRFHYPLGAGDSAGELIIGGIGFSRVLWTDPIAPPVGRSRALILTSETVVTSFLDGLVTEPALFPIQADAEITSVIQNLGLRALWSKRFSTGMSMGFPLSSAHLHDFSLLVEFQWTH